LKYEITFKNTMKRSKQIECDAVGSANGLISFDKREGDLIYPLYIYNVDDIESVINIDYNSDK